MNKKKSSDGVKHFYNTTEFSLVAIIVVLFVVSVVGTKNFGTEYNLMNLLKQCSIIGVLGIAETFIIITAGIDISVGAITGLSCMVLALLQSKMGIGIVPSVLIAVVIGSICGLYNAVIIYNFRVPPMIATLGSQTIIRGAVKIISDAKTISGLNKDFTVLGTASIGKIPCLSIIWIVVAILAFLVLKYTIFGRNLYVLGSGEEVARLSGIKVQKMYYMVYALCGTLCGIAGVMLAARINSAVPTAGQSYEMDAIAASVIGGASLTGGRGAVTGTILGTILMVIIENAGTQFGLNTFVLEITSGVLITVAVIIDQFKNRGKK
ncbi:MAG: ABC transporter permease [Blautia sp.]|jgi:ribose/xylose/arabinose/galactoside ABC-type transport system permease subunit